MTRLEAKRTMVVLALCTGCGPGHLGDLPTDSHGGSGEGSATDGADSSSAGEGPEQGEWHGVQIVPNKDVDILFVVDNSRSMGQSQANLAANMPAFLNVLDAEDVKANVRIAVTTTDLGNPWCASTTPEEGAFVATSCIERLADFSQDDLHVEPACTDTCQLATLPLRPTTTELDPEAKPRPWLELVEGSTNLPEETSLLAAVQCLIPQGNNGCEFVAPMEAARRAIERARTPTDPAYGFLRDGAHLAIVVVTDGDDCSSPFEQRAIFLPPEDCYDADGDGDDTDDCTQVYWTDPEAPAPTPGVCWNAGVECSGAAAEPDGTTRFASCMPADKDLAGEPTIPDDAVLYSVDGYADWLADLRTEKHAWSDELAVEAVAVIGTAIGEVSIPFATSSDPQLQAQFGIGPGCTNNSNGTFAMPPVRVLATLQHYYLDKELVAPRVHSICSNDFSPVLTPIANLLRDQIGPACVPACAADLDPATPALHLDCEVQQVSPPAGDPIITSVPECLADDAMPAESDVCWIALTGDDVASACTDQGYNLQLGIVRREGHPAPGGSEVQIRCVWTDPVDGVCPGGG